MADLAASVLAPVVESGVKSVVAVIKRQFIYLCCFITNIAALRDEAQNLDDATTQVQVRVNAANDNVRGIKPEVDSWLRASNNIKEETNIILNEVPNVGNGCLALRARFSLSKRAKKATEAMAQHRDKCKLFGDVSLPPSSAASRPTPLGTTYEFDSRKQIEQDIMTALRDKEDNNNMIGIHGMGGLGKTTMAKRIMNRVLEERVFQEVVIAVVSQTVDLFKIQLEIGGSLGLKDLKDETPQARVQQLHERLSSGTKRILIVLDDVWKSLKLKELGIPCEGDSKGCTILITSRNSDALSAMGVKKVFGMKQLSQEDAWFLFSENAGTCVEDAELNSTAKEIVKKCKGLPIAIEIVGAALKDEKSKSVWKNALKQLRKPNPKNTPGFIADVYKPLILSYDKLDNEEVKSLFLLFCLFQEDANIVVEELLYSCMGLRIFKDVESVEEARDRMCTLIKSLKTRSLLLDGANKDRVRMHDVVRDICIFIAKEKGFIGGNGANWISSSQQPVGEGTSELSTPNIRLLLSADDKIKIENKFFEGMRELYVLSIKEYSWTSLPLPKSLKSIRTLVLDWCDDLETISVVGSLINLEILKCRSCSRIKELPEELGGLKHLKLLDLTGCSGLKSIAPGIISGLVGLEELKMLRSFTQWEANEDKKEEKNAGLRELESLTKLTCLEIEIEDLALASQQINLSSNIQEFYIIIGSYHGTYIPNLERYSKTIGLRWKGGTCLGHWIEKLIRDSECLYLMGEGANNLDWTNVNPNIRWLKLEKLESMKILMDGDDGRRYTLFRHMEFLTLEDLPQLQEICKGPVSPNSFQNLKTISLKGLPALKVLCTTSMDDDDDDERYTLFSHVECLQLEDLPQLQEIWKGPTSPNSFQNLKTISLKDLPALKVLCTTSMDDDGRYALFPHIECLQLNNLPQLQQIWNAPASSNSFQNLKEIHLTNLPALKQLWKSTTSASFSQLQTLQINGCEMMEQLFLWGEEGQNITNVRECPKMTSIIPTNSQNADIDHHYHHLFCQPQKVSFGSLTTLAMDRNPFCRHINIHAPSFNQLEELYISKCEGNLSLFTHSIARNLANLSELYIGDCGEMVQVIEDDNEDDKVVSDGRLFPMLMRLQLKNLRKLVTFCKWKCDADQFPPLKQVTILGCPNMTPLVATLDLECFDTDLDNYLDAPFKEIRFTENENLSRTLHRIPLFSFHGLQLLYIQDYQGSRSIFSSSIARNLVNLRTLSICDCYEMVKVIEAGEEEGVPSGGQRTTTLLFPNLQRLSLWNVRKLETFCEWKRDVEWPLLERLEISRCPKMTKLTLGSVTAPHLKSVRINRTAYRIDASNDLNVELQQHFAQEKEEERMVMEKEMWMEMEMDMEMWKKTEMEMEMWMENKINI